MNEVNQYILDVIKKWVWSGFYDKYEVNDMIEDVLEDDADEKMLRAAIGLEFERKAVAEFTWPEVTDCDRLDHAFQTLNDQGIIALHNTGYEMSDGYTDVAEVLHEQGDDGRIGCCFYHGQDVERAMAGHGLLIAYDGMEENKEKQRELVI